MSATTPPRRLLRLRTPRPLHADVRTTPGGIAQAVFADAILYLYLMQSRIRHTQISCAANVTMLHFLACRNYRRLSRMGWFRAKSKLGGRLALFALAVQFILAFGHIHPDDIYGSLNTPSPAHAVKLAMADSTQSLSSDHSGVVNDEFCAICATVSLLGSSVADDAPKLALPEPQTVERAACTPDGVVTSPRRPFQSRAPPSA
jgi:hypothetical protein